MDATTLIAILTFLALVIFTGYLIIYNIFHTKAKRPAGFTRQVSLYVCAIGMIADYNRL